MEWVYPQNNSFIKVAIIAMVIQVRAMALYFGNMYKLAVQTKMLPFVHVTYKNLVWSCTPPVQVSTEL